ncbi:MAG: tRNA-guanine transglycosylase, partial [Candidatus Fonsibacter sp.]
DRGRFNVSNAPYKKDFGPIQAGCNCYTCKNYSRAYICHLFRAKEMVASTLATIHNEFFIINLVDQMRNAIENNEFFDFKNDFLGRYLGD